MSRVDCLGKVLIVVNWQEVSMGVSVANHHLYIRQVVNMQNELVELLKFSRFEPVYREPSELCPILALHFHGVAIGVSQRLRSIKAPIHFL